MRACMHSLAPARRECSNGKGRAEEGFVCMVSGVCAHMGAGRPAPNGAEGVRVVSCLHAKLLKHTRTPHPLRKQVRQRRLGNRCGCVMGVGGVRGVRECECRDTLISSAQAGGPPLHRTNPEASWVLDSHGVDGPPKRPEL